jgi:uncharacterized membrane protein
MIRKLLIGPHTTGESGFRWRGQEVTRLEGFTDAVFAFAVALLVVSLEVPKTYPELMEAMHGFLAFGICFALLTIVWYEHYRFFRRYGLENLRVVALNCALLFFVLFYVYPLKFLFTAALSRAVYSDAEVRMLYSVFAFGFAAVSAVFALLYQYAWQIRAELSLNRLEELRTRHSLTHHLVMLLIGVLSLLLAQLTPSNAIGLTALIYFVIPVYATIAGRIAGRQERRLSSSSTDDAPPP